MQRISIPSCVRFVLVSAFLLTWIAAAGADDFSGAWVMNANGWKFTLKIEQSDDTLSGTMTGINNDQSSRIEGKVSGNKITFSRIGVGQEYEGYLLNDDPTKKASDHAVAGIAKSGDVSFGWYLTGPRRWRSPMGRVLKPPTPIVLRDGEKSVFLAGSIEMGRAEPWQAAVEQALADTPAVILNPRRDEWDASWVQSIGNPQFRGQVEWELEGQERASVIAMYFAPATQAPITLLELGLFARSGRLVVCCPPGFWRRGNVEVVCARYDIPLLAELPQLIVAVRERVGTMGN